MSGRSSSGCHRSKIRASRSTIQYSGTPSSCRIWRLSPRSARAVDGEMTCAASNNVLTSFQERKRPAMSAGTTKTSGWSSRCGENSISAGARSALGPYFRVTVCAGLARQISFRSLPVLACRADPPSLAPEWFWHHCCKTQYASVVSWDHLIRCHLSLVALLDYAIERGIDVVVRDEGHYWETRDTASLVSEVDYMNKVVAALAGRLGDAIERTGHTVGAPIFEHREFEHLEMEPKKKPSQVPPRSAKYDERRGSHDQ